MDVFLKSTNKDQELLSLILLSFNTIELDNFIFIINQIIYGLVIKENKQLEILVRLLIKLAIRYP